MQIASVTITDENIAWNAINWQKVNRRVNNLRRRIYRASCEGNMKLVRSLQRLTLRSRSNKLQAIRRVTQINQGRNTAGVDKVVVNTDKERNLLLKQLASNDTKSVKPIKRVYIPKKNGKSRPLGIPTIGDRCKQAVVKTALEPYWEAKFEKCSYGFRPGRSAHDAIQKAYNIARTNKSKKWVLDADIEGAFDNIDHNFLMKIIGNFPGRNWIKAWLTSGVMEGWQITQTATGTPQGGIISPLLLNIALHGMETILGINYHKNGTIKPSSECQLVKYADDFIIFARCKEDCLKAKAKLTPWLAERGLKLSEAKTHIHHMDDGFDFLGFNIKHYKDKRKKTGKTCHTKPSKESIKAFKQQMVIEWKKMLGVPTKRLIENINPKIKGWSNYFRIGVSSSIFSKLDHWMWQRQAIYAGRRHPHKSWRWKKEKYWGRIKGRNDNWIFMDKDHKHTYLWKMSWTPIKRHIMVKGSSSPDDPALKEYWRARQAKNCKYIVKLRSILWRKQKGICPVCKDNIDNGESIDIHHITPRKLGGGDQLENLVMLHTNCHRQTHSKAGQQIQDVSKLLEPYAG